MYSKRELNFERSTRLHEKLDWRLLAAMNANLILSAERTSFKMGHSAAHAKMKNEDTSVLVATADMLG